MKYLKAAALILSLLFVVLALASCDGGDTDAETTTEEPADVTIDFYFYLESDNETVVIDEYGDLVVIGTVEAGTVSEEGKESYTTYWWWNLNGREATTDPKEYTVKDGDKIEYYLKRVSADVTGGKKK